MVGIQTLDILDRHAGFLNDFSLATTARLIIRPAVAAPDPPAVMSVEDPTLGSGSRENGATYIPSVEAPNRTPVHGPVGSTFVANPGAWHQDGADEPRREASR
jgi:hypothetical protein